MDGHYLAEFAAFYSTSSKGYPNLCRRLHFFSGKPVTRQQIQNAASGGQRTLNRLQRDYLGFVVLRPIPAAPLGRTVMRWYPDSHATTTPRVVTPSRVYEVHVSGVTLEVIGLAWQQQDSAVGACATIGLWTILHSSAFDDHHAIPTTADITQAAHKHASLGARIFPSTGLTVSQICEAIKEQNLSPVLFEGDVSHEDGKTLGFSQERFASSCAALLRSGYPVLLIGILEGQGGHAICAVGFRTPKPRLMLPHTVNTKKSSVEFEDSSVEHLYIHDDNLGPSVRFRIEQEQVEVSPEKIRCVRQNEASECECCRVISAKTKEGVVLKPDPPPPRSSRPSPDCPATNYTGFRPIRLLVAVHNGLRTSPDTLHHAGLVHAKRINDVYSVMGSRASSNSSITFSTRFIKLAAYIGDTLSQTLSHQPKVLGRVRVYLCEQVPPMSLHIGVVRIGLRGNMPFGGMPLIDILYDTTDSDRNHPVFAHVVYDRAATTMIAFWREREIGKYGVFIKAY